MFSVVFKIVCRLLHVEKQITFRKLVDSFRNPKLRSPLLKLKSRQLHFNIGCQVSFICTKLLFRLEGIIYWLRGPEKTHMRIEIIHIRIFLLYNLFRFHTELIHI